MNSKTNTSDSVSELDKTIVTSLNALIHICHEAHDGYMQAAEGITSAAYKTMFAEYALQRRRFASQLANLILEHGGDPDDDGQAMSLFSRGWTIIEPVLMGGDYGAIFSECERSEGIAINAYARVLENELAQGISRIITMQYQQIVEAHDRLRNFREAYYLEHKTGAV